MNINISILTLIIFINKFFCINNNNNNNYNNSNYNNNNNNNNNFICLNSLSCSYKGKCISNTKCECEKYYTNFIEKNNFQCNYKLLSKKKLFLFSFFFGPFGIDHLYKGNIFKCLIKIILPSLIIIIGSILLYLSKKNNIFFYALLGKLFDILGTIIIIFWWLFDWIFILTMKEKDYNGYFVFNDI